MNYPQGVLKLAKVYLAVKRKLKVGIRWPAGTVIRVS
jgi:hypothetical protein